MSIILYDLLDYLMPASRVNEINGGSNNYNNDSKTSMDRYCLLDYIGRHSNRNIRPVFYHIYIGNCTLNE